MSAEEQSQQPPVNSQPAQDGSGSDDDDNRPIVRLHFGEYRPGNDSIRVAPQIDPDTGELVCDDEGEPLWNLDLRSLKLTEDESHYCDNCHKHEILMKARGEGTFLIFYTYAIAIVESWDTLFY